MEKNDEFPLQEFLPFLLNQAAEESSLAFQAIYKSHYGMLRTEWRVLFHLGNYGQMTAKEIGHRARIHKTKISRAVRKLGEKRMVTRTRDEQDRRSEHLRLTATGESAYRHLREVAREYDKKLTSQFTTGEVAMLRMMLRRLADMQ